MRCELSADCWLHFVRRGVLLLALCLASPLGLQQRNGVPFNRPNMMLEAPQMVLEIVAFEL